MENREGMVAKPVEKLRTECLWHEKYFGKKFVIQERSDPTDTRVSHGVCRDCKNKALEEMGLPLDKKAS